MEKSGFTRARGAHQGNKLTSRNGQVDVVERRNLELLASIGLRQISYGYGRIIHWYFLSVGFHRGLQLQSYSLILPPDDFDRLAVFEAGRRTRDYLLSVLQPTGYVNGLA